jgi:hypothetical protein
MIFFYIEISNQKIKLYFCLSMITNCASCQVFFLDRKFKKNTFKLNLLVDLIFGNIECWHPIRAEGCQNLTKYRMDLKIVSTQPQRILMNLQSLFEFVLLAILVKKRVNVLSAPHTPPPTTNPLGLNTI